MMTTLAVFGFQSKNVRAARAIVSQSSSQARGVFMSQVIPRFPWAYIDTAPDEE